MKEKSTLKFSKALEPLLNTNFDKSNEMSHSSYLENEDIELHQTHNKSLSEDNDIPRPTIPIGSRFQAEVPKWEGTTNVNNDDDSKWLGVQVLPMPNIIENHKEGIGEGRLDSCYCTNLGSDECVKLHIKEARELLKLEISATFSSWKFDEMREEFSQSWTLEEDKKFESLMKLNMSPKTRN
ncbi:uncharacterized protein HKW66_Vig0116320 [Vigna angularis]|uniref:ELM2 domain-containing protein n=1 Tax=Phaseolus angularis TaxID=3914 RepID=A0A8T0KWH7_PHAAN|nr:uncharacterized protein HKW66_Vig0116320 [Vigna angularis]